MSLTLLVACAVLLEQCQLLVEGPEGWVLLMRHHGVRWGGVALRGTTGGRHWQRRADLTCEGDMQGDRRGQQCGGQAGQAWLSAQGSLSSMHTPIGTNKTAELTQLLC